MHEHGEYHGEAAVAGGSGGARVRAPRAGDARPHRLDQRTYLDGGRCRVILRPYGDGLAEVGWSFVPASLPIGAAKGKAEDRAAHELRAIRRARSTVRQLILAASLDHLLTLTYRANVTDYGRASADLSRYIRKVRRSFLGAHYVAVPEQQQRGAWHWHLAVRGRQDVYLHRAAWLQVVGDGNIDVKAPVVGASRGPLALARYLSKYLSKGFTAGNRRLNGHRFRASHGIAIPERAIEVPPDQRGNVRELALKALADVAGAVGFIWESDDRTAGWACSWK